jgi:ABC-type nitrate/sulfonate/bicarbonate transport system substrate-binding protein
MFARTSRIVSLFIAIALIAGCKAPAKELTKVTVMLDWTPNTNHTGLYVAQAQGYFKAQGLEVQIVPPGESGTTVPVVAAGKADFGISFQDEVTNARATDVPVVSVAAIIQHNTSVLVSLKDRNITRPKDLEGKKYASWGLELERQVLTAFMQCDGGDFSKLQLVDVGASDSLTAISRDLDVAWIYEGWEGIQAQMRGMAVNTIRFTDWTKCVPDYYTPVIITSEDTIAKHPDVVKKFLAATTEGYRYAIAHPSESADILIKAAPEADPELIRQSQAWLSPRYQADAPRWGEQKLSVWQAYAGWLSDRGLLGKQIDPAKAFTNDYLPK